MGKLNDILQGLETALEKISVANGYQLNVAQVDRNFEFEESQKFPAILIVAGSGSYEGLSGNRSRVPNTFTVYGYVKDDRALQATAVKMREDITRCIGREGENINAITGADVVSAGAADDIFPGGYGYAPGFMFPFACVKVVCGVEYDILNTDGG